MPGLITAPMLVEQLRASTRSKAKTRLSRLLELHR